MEFDNIFVGRTETVKKEPFDLLKEWEKLNVGWVEGADITQHQRFIWQQFIPYVLKELMKCGI